MSIHPAFNALEADAAAVVRHQDLPPGEYVIELSKAISLKRIADALSGQGDSIINAPLNCFGETIGNVISGQIARGMRGDDR